MDPRSRIVLSIARPSRAVQMETNKNFTFGFSLTILVQPPLFSSALQLEHHGAQRCTTVRSGDLIASATCCSVGGNKDVRGHGAKGTLQPQSQVSSYFWCPGSLHHRASKLKRPPPKPNG